MTIRTVILFLVSIITLTACGMTSEQEVNDQVDSTMLKPIHYNETFENLSYDIQLAKNQFGLDEEIEVSWKVTNLGNEVVHFGGSSSCPAPVIVEIVHQKSNTSLVFRSKICTMDLGGSELAPGEAIENKEYFIPKQRINSKLKLADTGTYDVKVFLRKVNFILAQITLYQVEGELTEQDPTTPPDTDITADDGAFQGELSPIIEEELAKQYPISDESMNDFIWYWDNVNRKAIFVVDNEDSIRWQELRKNLEARLGSKVVVRKAKTSLKHLRDMVAPISDFLVNEKNIKDCSVSWSPITEKVTVEIYEYTEELADEIKARFGSEDIEVIKMGIPQ